MEIDGSNSEDEDTFSPTRQETDKKLFGKTFGTDNKKKTNVLKRPRKPRANIRRPNTVKMTRLHGTDIAYTDDIKIGQGATSIVYKGYYGEIPCAVKRVDSEYVDVYENELAIWQHMKDKTEDGNVNIVSLFKWHPWKEGGGGTTYYFAMELALCDLAKRVKELKQWRDAKDPQFVEQEKKLPRFLHGAVKGLMWIHNKRILHRDIKPENVLIFETSNGEIAKLGDFGISRKLSETSTGTNSVGRGTSDWMAPEALQAMNNEETFFSTRNIDIFSLGMTSHYAISLGSHPFKFKSRFGIFIMTNIMQKSVQPTNLNYPHLDADHLFQWMMQKEEKQATKFS
ncbi:Serine/threonine-protein kinase/endoribonuclease IRE2 [Orchesella cincta]|uniref:Serine/threonine-protein kinase/endoribonuclease IRE2 n=1 Tax=Orchesella cincta TaxID=48709 RepID=A0A1D2MBQ1_ORCCI|nr:Serine/threonine-protein kinase/endoribonuclease IRE2 [Orchesella cincta]